MPEQIDRRHFLQWSAAASATAMPTATAPADDTTGDHDNPCREARLAMRRGEWTGPTVSQLPDYVQCNLVVLSKAFAYDFLVYCQRNPKACPVIEVTDPGDPNPCRSAAGADLARTYPGIVCIDTVSWKRSDKTFTTCGATTVWAS